MKHLNNFEEFNEGKLSNFVAGAAVAGATLYGANAIVNPNTKATAKYQETELAHFPEFYVKTLGMDNNLNVSVNEYDGVIGCQMKQGKHSRYTITVEEDINQVYYKLSTFGEYIYATTNESNLPGCSVINISELEVVEETGEYRILRVPSFWSSLDFILVNKGYSNNKNKFEMNGVRYTYFEKSFSFLEGNGSFVVKVR
ncbi:MAG TPA: hypothetical protein PKG93_04425 [Bacilli bacterium]|mgnify:CR=1 FL=1|nr:hypothetical protein [Bacilli bacterium]HPZ23824.1 hypothetical protein [Bacilli bacterium]